MVRMPARVSVLVTLLTTSLAAQTPLPTTKQPADPLNGPPFVTARAWAMADAKTGAFLTGLREDEILPMASLTKVMTAYTVLKLAQKDTSLLAEVVNVSRFAANTGGSSATLRQGDRISVQQLLYGLLLPSGNDAANALAEHFGKRCKPSPAGEAIPWTPATTGRSPMWGRFVAEMNRHAKRLSMTKTSYVNPHGLDSRGHRSTARDTLRVMAAAMRLDPFRRIVGCRRYRAKWTGGDGRARTVTWANTNQLLAIKGYNGCKTGTTARAGCCLASSAIRGENHLYLVVLNSANRDSRYVDSRNLFRWGFSRRAAGGR